MSCLAQDWAWVPLLSLEPDRDCEKRLACLMCSRCVTGPLTSFVALKVLVVLMMYF